MRIDRAWAMPSAWTFTIKPIMNLLQDEGAVGLMKKGVWIDPFAGMNSPADITNDINPKANAKYHLDAIEFLKKQKSQEYDGALLDPPYSYRQVSEHHKAVGIKVTGWHTSSGWGKTIKDEITRIVKPHGKVISFGWNSMGLGKNRGFVMERILLVAHGGGKNDTICTVEIKIA